MIALRKPLILASVSARRQELLSLIGVKYTIMPSLAKEAFTQTDPQKLVLSLAEQKASDVADRTIEDALVLGADTLVVQGPRILGKPKDFEDAVAMLQLLQGKKHTVYTGICAIDARSGRKEYHVEATQVEICPLTDAQIRAYIATGEPMDKAGAYAVQGLFAVYIKGIIGCYYNVMGLPLHATKELLERFNKI